MLILSWFCSLISNLFEKIIYGTNDRLKFTLPEEKRLLMIEEGDYDEGLGADDDTHTPTFCL